LNNNEEGKKLIFGKSSNEALLFNKSKKNYFYIQKKNIRESQKKKLNGNVWMILN